MFEKDIAKKIVEKVSEKKVCLISDESNFITRYTILKYYYSSKEERSNHIKKLQELGYELIEDIGEKERLYADFSDHTRDWIYIWFAKYIKHNKYKPFF